MESTPQPKPTRTYKSFKYGTSLKWTGDRNGTLHADDRPDFDVSSPPEFKGDADKWTPEDLFVAAIDICTMTTFLAFAQHKKIAVVSYESSAEGLLEYVDGNYQITNVVLRPRIVVEGDDMVDRTIRTIESAHDKCIISNSCNTKVVVEPEVTAA